MATFYASIPSVYVINSSNGTVRTQTATTPLTLGFPTQSEAKIKVISPADTTTIAGVTLNSVIEFPMRAGVQERWFCSSTVAAIIAITNA